MFRAAKVLHLVIYEGRIYLVALLAAYGTRTVFVSYSHHAHFPSKYVVMWPGTTTPPL